MLEIANNSLSKTTTFNYHLIILGVFVTVNTLYYFLRYQFNIDQLILMSYLTLQLYISLIALLSLINIGLGRKAVGSIDLICLVLLFINLYLLVITFFRSPGLTSISYSLKDYLFPVLLFFYCRKIIRKDAEWESIINFIPIAISVVALIYLLEFINTIFLGNDAFAYTLKIRELITTLNGIESSGLTNTRMFIDDSYLSIRFEGPLAHNNSTALALALGAVSSLLVAKYNRSYFFYTLFLFNGFVLMLSASRTNIIAMVIAMLFLWLLRKSSKILRKSKKRRKIAIWIKFLFLLVSSIAFYWIVFESPIKSLFTLESVLSPIKVIMNNTEITAFVQMLKQPLLYGGVGFAIPGDDSGLFEVIRSDDLYFIQLISMYGLPGILLFAAGFLTIIKGYKKFIRKFPFENNLVIDFGIVFVALPFISTLHAGSFGRPQIYPLVFIGMAAIAHSFERLYLRSNLVKQPTQVSLKL